MSFKPTSEQTHCIGLVFKADQTKIDAGAGAAKTTTLSMIAKENPQDSLYLAFNKAMVVEAGDRFPSWVDVKTTHSLAYASFGGQLRSKLQRPQGGYVNVCGTGNEIAKYFKIQMQETVMGKRITPASIGLAVRNTVNNFEYSADKQIGSKHVSYIALQKVSKQDHFDSVFYEAVVIDLARELWELRKDVTSKILATHDTYLKLYQLSKPDLSHYGIIYLDEGQDTNDCVLDIFNTQTSKKVIVGDEFQQIYGFRGSVNAMQKVKAETGYLTTSFRFGQDVADLANMILGKTKKDGLKGWDQLKTEVVMRADQRTSMPAKYTMLYRTNAALLSDAVMLIGEGKKVNLEIDTKDFIKKLETAAALYKGEMKNVKHEDFLAYESWKELEEENNKGELGRIVKLVNAQQHWKVIAVLNSHSNTDNPDIIMTTAHKSKGREWDNVILAGDFPSPYDNDGAWVGLEDMERNLLYVAVTRAKKYLGMDETCEEFFVRYELGYFESVSALKVTPAANDERADMAHFYLNQELDAEMGDVNRAIFG